MERPGLADSELAEDGAPEARPECGRDGQPEPGAHRHPENAYVRVFREP